MKSHSDDEPSGSRAPHEQQVGTLSADTDPKAEAVQLEIFRRMPSWQKAKLWNDAIESSWAVARAGLRARYPKADEAELARRLADLQLGPELAATVYGPLKSEDS